MAFRVDEGVLDSAADRLTDLGPAVTRAEVYTAAHVDLGGLGDSGIFITAIGVLDDIREAVEDELGQLRSLTLASAEELRATARDYQATDDAIDAAMDDRYGRITRPPVRVGNYGEPV